MPGKIHLPELYSAFAEVRLVLIAGSSGLGFARKCSQTFCGTGDRERFNAKLFVHLGDVWPEAVPVGVIETNFNSKVMLLVEGTIHPNPVLSDAEQRVDPLAQAIHVVDPLRQICAAKVGQDLARSVMGLPNGPRDTRTPNHSPPRVDSPLLQVVPAGCRVGENEINWESERFRGIRGE
jgi:hypothetical protein